MPVSERLDCDPILSVRIPQIVDATTTLEES
jgi:hypothetical protein